MFCLPNASLISYALGKLTLEYVPRMGRAPCEDPDGFTLTAHGLQAILIVVGVWLQVRLLRRPSYASLIPAILVPLTACLIQHVADDREASRQQQCAARPLAAAMKACGANPIHYRQNKDQSGYTVLTVIAPGTTDQAWSCLERWSIHNGEVALKVDESVYRQYRRTNK
jgi:glucose dehydrogenase